MTVLIPPLDAQSKWSNDKAVRATMVATPFRDEEGELFFTLAFTPVSPPEESQVEDCCGAEHVGYADTLIWSSDTASSMSTSTLQSKISMLKEALIDAMELPIFAMWGDGSVVVLNRSVAALLNPPEGPVDDAKAEKRPEFDRSNFVKNFRMFTEDFKRELDVTEYPIMKLCRQREGFDSIRVGVLSKDGEKKVYDAGGKCLQDKNGEFLAGLTWLRDRTEMSEIQRKLDAEGLQNEAQFRNICDCMPQMVCSASISEVP